MASGVGEGRVRFATASLSRPGGRSHNEDAFGSAEVGDDHCWVVADGLGGQGGGDRASRIAVEKILGSFQEAAEPSGENLQRHLAAAQKAIWEAREQSPSLSSMSTTAVALVTDGAVALWAHVGDSRLYFLRSGRIAFQSRDHSVPQRMADAGEIRADEIRHHEDRSRLLRTLGGKREGRPAIAAAPQALDPGDAFLLCTDGWWEHVLESEIEDDIAGAASPEQWLARMEARRIARAREGSDNYTAIAILCA